MPTQFVKCVFKPGDSRAYTYANDGEPVVVGDIVKVPDNRSGGFKRVEVIDVTDEEPSFACKPIIGKWEPTPETSTNLPDPDDLASDVAF